MEKSPAAPCHGEQKGQSDLAQAAGAHPCTWFRRSGAFVLGAAAASSLVSSGEAIARGAQVDCVHKPPTNPRDDYASLRRAHEVILRAQRSIPK